MSAKKGADWQGWFNKVLAVTPEKYPTGTWRVDLEIPSSTDTLRQKFQVRQSNPELDITRPDMNSLYAMASSVADVRVKDQNVLSKLGQIPTGSGAEGKKLAFRFGDEESLKLIPECVDSQTVRPWNRGAVEDYWDKGVELPSFLTKWYSEKPMRVGLAMLAIVGLLSIEWLTRKLLKLA